MTAELEKCARWRREIIRRYGEGAFYKKLEEFIETHRAQRAEIEFDTELEMPVRAVYYFEPLEVMKDHLDLMEAISKELGKGEG